MQISDILAIIALLISIISTIISIRTKKENALLKAAEKRSTLIISYDQLINRTEINLIKLKDLYYRILDDTSFAERIKKEYGEKWVKILHEKFLKFEDLIAKREDILEKFTALRDTLMDDSNTSAIKAEHAMPNLENLKMTAKNIEDTTSELENEIEKYIKEKNAEIKSALNLKSN